MWEPAISGMGNAHNCAPKLQAYPPIFSLTPKASGSTQFQSCEVHYNEEEEKRKLRKAEYEAGKNDGIKIGREEEKRKIANSLFKEGDSIEKVARILCESEETIRGWVNEKMDIKVE